MRTRGVSTADPTVCAQIVSLLVAFFPASKWAQETRDLWLAKLVELGDSGIAMSAANQLIEEPDRVFAPSWGEFLVTWRRLNHPLRIAATRQPGPAELGPASSRKMAKAALADMRKTLTGGRSEIEATGRRTA